MTLLQESEILKKTPLYDRHAALKGRLVNFNGWSLPVYYSSIIAEHLSVRQSCGFFDVSHLGELRVQGPGALDLIQRCTTQDLRKCRQGRLIYSLICDERGMTMDDILVVKENQEDYYLIVNAGNVARDLAQLQKNAHGDVQILDKSAQTACLAVQGPKSEPLLEALFKFELKNMPYYSFKEEIFLSERVWITRSGYTGEDGFELFCDNELIGKLWDRLVTEGKAMGAAPAGLGARNTLRLEAGNVLYGHELNENTTPLEAGLAFAVSWDKGDYVGRDALLSQKQKGIQKRLVAFKMLDKAVARENYAVFKNQEKVGHVTSGSFAPSLGENIGMAYVKTAHQTVTNQLEIEIHGKLSRAEIVKRPFVPIRHHNESPPQDFLSGLSV